MPDAFPSGKIEDPGDLGRAVRRRRKELGLTQAELAGLCGLGTRFVSDLENGKATARLGLALQVCAALGLELEIRRRGWTSGGAAS